MRTLALVIVLALLPAPAALAGLDRSAHDSLWGVARVLHGRASYYGQRFVGRETASGERYDANAMTAAHRTLPLGSQVRVISPSTKRAVVVRINDRGPYVRGRTIDLSRRAAQMLGITGNGICEVTIEVVALPG